MSHFAASTIFRGVLAFPVTPMDDLGEEIALKPLENLLDRIIDGGVNAIIPLGSTGEFAYLSLEERKRVAESAIDIADGRVPVIIGASAIATRDAVQLVKHAEERQADGIMLSLPTYYSLTDDEVVAHIASVARATSLPIMLYNNPFTSLVDLTPQLLERCAEITNVVAVKEATTDTNRITLLQQRLGNRMEILGGGFDPYAFSALCLGVTGWTTGMANLIPEKCASLFEAVAVNRDLEKGRQLHAEIHPLATLLVELGLTKAVKAGLKMLGVDVGRGRAPLDLLPPASLDRLENTLLKVRDRH